jgi:V/A-type H+-transporting ATPase subunit K
VDSTVWKEILHYYFVETGLGFAIAGAIAAVSLGCIGSAHGIQIAAGQAAGVMSEKPELFGRLLILIALPGTQGFYSFVIAILIAVYSGLTKATVAVSPPVGLGLLAIGVCAGASEWRSAVHQGTTSAASINLTAKRPSEAGRSILLPALVETYAVLTLLASILLIIWITSADLKLAEPRPRYAPAAAEEAAPSETP